MVGDLAELWQRVHSEAGPRRPGWWLKRESVPWPELQPAVIRRNVSTDQLHSLFKMLPHDYHWQSLLVTQSAVQCGGDVVRCGRMRRLPVADDTTVGRGKTGPEVAHRAVACGPVAEMASRGRLAVAPDAEVLPVADLAALPVTFCREPVAQCAPGVRVVARHARVVAGNAIRLLVTDQTIVAH